MARAKAEVSAESSAKLVKKRKPRGKPFEKGNALAFKPGESGNPGGAPKGEKFETTLSRYLERDGAEVSKLIVIARDARKMVGVTFQDVLILRTLDAFCSDPNGAFFTTLRETKEGKLKETMDLNVNDVDAEIRRELARLAGAGKAEDAPTAPGDANAGQGQAA